MTVTMTHEQYWRVRAAVAHHEYFKERIRAEAESLQARVLEALTEAGLTPGCAYALDDQTMTATKVEPEP